MGDFLAKEMIDTTCKGFIEYLGKINLENIKEDEKTFKSFLKKVNQFLRILNRYRYDLTDMCNSSVSHELLLIKGIVEDIEKYKDIRERDLIYINSNLNNIKNNDKVFKYMPRSDSGHLFRQLSNLYNIKCLNNRPYNIFFPDIDKKNHFSATFLNQNLFSLKGNNILYTSTEKEYLYSTFKEFVDYRILGKAINDGARISNHCFDIVVKIPEINNNMELKNIEKQDVYNCFKFLRENGVYIIIIPFSRCSDDILLMLSKKLKNINISSLKNLQSDVFISGSFVSEKKEDEITKDYEELLNIFDGMYEDLPSTHDFSNYCLPSKEIEVDLFRGGRISKEEMCSYCIESELVESFIKKNKEEKREDTKPLLPFNLGQVGLVLTSSQLNGVVYDDNNIPHIIKGMTIKETDKQEDYRDSSEVRSTEVISNRVQINILSADGEKIKIS